MLEKYVKSYQTKPSQKFIYGLVIVSTALASLFVNSNLDLQALAWNHKNKEHESKQKTKIVIKPKSVISHAIRIAHNKDCDRCNIFHEKEKLIAPTEEPQNIIIQPQHEATVVNNTTSNFIANTSNINNNQNNSSSDSSPISNSNSSVSDSGNSNVTNDIVIEGATAQTSSTPIVQQVPGNVTQLPQTGPEALIYSVFALIPLGLKLRKLA